MFQVIYREGTSGNWRTSGIFHDSRGDAEEELAMMEDYYRKAFQKPAVVAFKILSFNTYSHKTLDLSETRTHLPA